MKTKTLAVPILTVLVLGACSAKDSISPDLGNAVNYNKQIQMVNPEAAMAASTDQQIRDGHAAASAYERFRNGMVVRPSPAPSPKLGGVK